MLVQSHAALDVRCRLSATTGHCPCTSQLLLGCVNVRNGSNISETAPTVDMQLLRVACLSGSDGGLAVDRLLSETRSEYGILR